MYVYILKKQMRRFNFFDRDAVKTSPALSCLDITSVSGGRGAAALGDSEGHVVFADREFVGVRGSAFQAHRFRINALYLLKSSDVLVTIGDGADARPPAVRAASRSAALAARERLRRDMDREKSQLQSSSSNDAQEDDEDDSENGGGVGGGGAIPERDLGDILGLGVPLEGAASALVRGDSTWTAGSSLSPTPGGWPQEKSSSGTIGIGKDSSSSNTNINIPCATLKVWRLDRRDVRAGSMPECVRTVRIFPGGVATAASAGGGAAGTNSGARSIGGNSAVSSSLSSSNSGSGTSGSSASDAKAQIERVITSLSVSEDLNMVAIGCGDGAVIVLRGDLLRGGIGETGGRFQRGMGAALGIATSLANMAVGAGLGASSLKPQILNDGNPNFLSSLSSALSDGGDAVSNDLAQQQQQQAAGVSVDAQVTFLAFVSHADPSLAAATQSSSTDPQTAGSMGSAAASGVDALNDAGPSGGNGPLPPGRSRQRGGPASRSGRMLCLFACTPARLRCYFPTEIRPMGMGRGWSPGEFVTDLDDLGCAHGCSSITDAGELVVGNDSGVFFYSYEGRRAAYVLPGKKQRLGWFRQYLILASEDAATSAPSGINNSRGGGAMVASRNQASTTVVTVYDLRAKYIAYSMSLGVSPAAASIAPPAIQQQQQQQRGGGSISTNNSASVVASATFSSQIVRHIISEWGTVFLLVSPELSISHSSSSPPTSSSLLSVYQLSEKDTGTKVEHLCRLALFDTAVAVAQAANYGTEHLADIYKLRGDHLYSRGEHDAAVEQYVKTIGSVEPSYVIRRFLDSTRISNLTSYLEALHREGRAAADHTTLLLNCYTKARQQEKLRDFIRGEGSASRHSSGNNKNNQTSTSSSALTFDVRTAIGVLREAACYSEALFLAEQQGEHDWVLAIHIDDFDSSENLDKKSSVPSSTTTTTTSSSTAAAAISQSQSTSSSATVSTAAARPPPPPPSSSSSSTSSSLSSFGALSAIAYIKRLPFVDAEFFVRKYGRSLVLKCAKEATDLVCMLCSKWVQEMPYLRSSGEAAALNTGVGMGDESRGLLSTSTRPNQKRQERTRTDSPDSFLPLFADQPLWLRRFCNVLVSKSSSGESIKLSQAIWHSLLEVSLRRESFESDVIEKFEAEKKAASSIDDIQRSPLRQVNPQTQSSGGSVTVNDTNNNNINNKNINESNSSNILSKNSALLSDSAWDAWREENVLRGILRNLSANVDPATALALCQLHQYRSGTLFLYEKLKMFPLVVSYIMDTADTARSSGRHAEAKAARRELVRKAKSFTSEEVTNSGVAIVGVGGGGGGGGISGASSSSSSSSSKPPSLHSASTSTSPDTAGVDAAAGLWISILRYLSRTYLSELGYSISLSEQQQRLLREEEEKGDGGESSLSSSTSTSSFNFPGLTPGSTLLLREREEQDSLIADVLRHIERTSALEPTVVLSVLAECPYIPFGLVRDFVVRKLASDQERCEEDRRAVDSLRADAESMMREKSKLDREPKVFQSRKCRLCALELDLPSVHFMCGGLINSGGGGGNGNLPLSLSGGSGSLQAVSGDEHSFHQHCVLDSMAANLSTGSNGIDNSGNSSGASGSVSLECPICSPQQRQVRYIKSSLGARSDTNEQFYTELKLASDGFGKATEWLSKGLPFVV